MVLCDIVCVDDRPRPNPTPRGNAALVEAPHLAWYGEALCIASLSMVIDEIAAEEAHGDEAYEAEITARLRHRAGLEA